MFKWIFFLGNREVVSYLYVYLFEKYFYFEKFGNEVVLMGLVDFLYIIFCLVFVVGIDCLVVIIIIVCYLKFVLFLLKIWVVYFERYNR